MVDFLTVFCVAAIAWLLHVVALHFSRDQSTHGGRVWGYTMAIVYCSVIPIAGFATYQPDIGVSAFIIGMLIVCVWMPGLQTYSVPSSTFSAVVLALHYLILAFAVFSGFLPLFLVSYLPLAGFLFPRHRRLCEYWAPRRLSRIRSHQAGITLIELLIAVAIVSILAVSIGYSVAIALRTARAESEWREAISLAEDEIALLRANLELPAVGTHEIESELAESNPLADLAEVEILPGPLDEVREARVTVRLSSGGDANRHDVVLTALLPVNPAGEGQ